MKRTILLISILCITLTGCQKTPEKSAVVSKADGLGKGIAIKPLKNGEKRATDIPEHWKMDEEKNKDRVVVSADLDLGKMEIGNLPVKEMKNYAMSQDKLENLVSYFAKGEDLYVPQIHTKDVYQKNIDRIENKEGVYGYRAIWTLFKDIENAMKKAVTLAPESPAQAEKTDINFRKKIEDPALAAAQREEDKKEDNAKIYFSADVGKERTSHIDAQRYDSKVGSSSDFSWKQGAGIIESNDIQSAKMSNDFSMQTGQDTTGYDNKFDELLGQYEARLKEEPFGEDEGEKQAEKVLSDLDITDMKLSSSQKVLWFPKGAIPDKQTAGLFDDLFWQGDLGKAKAGYQYVFSPSINGISVGQITVHTDEKTANAYSSPFPVESVTITVTGDGIVSFYWEGMAKEAKVIADNTKLLPFKAIQEKLLEQVFYWGTKSGQPADDPTVFRYIVTSAQFLYTYIPAYKKPEDSWLVPAWVFKVRENSGGKDAQYMYFVFNALDGVVVENAR